ncbi:protein LNK1-like isoform X1 [Salvia splendens]|uniref:protein LNK1-like isoform X1 n=1 Tax=Salvia splendens TaxID=180675 RepID=UPI0011036EE5|nr:protein LNK1-like isoform X1 [Salvia splendens]XP_042064669.1 protein LNK1-like isoform X1 [Salvia splendens]
MTDSGMYEFEDIGWDDLCQSDDHIVPRPLEDHSLLCDSSKKPHFEETNIAYNTEGRQSAGHVDQRREQGKSSLLSKRKYRIPERDSTPGAPSVVFFSSTDAESTKEASGLASEITTSSTPVHESSNTDTHGNQFCVTGTTGFKTNSSTDPLGDITHAGNNLNFFENDEVKDSSDFFNFGWPEIENFEDVDRIFRSCDSTFGLGASREDEFRWFSASDNIGSTGELVNSDFKFPSPESNSAENLSSNHTFLKGHSSNDGAMVGAPIRLRDGSWISENPESHVSYVDGHAIANGEQGCNPKAHLNRHQNQVQDQFEGKIKEHDIGNGASKLPDDAVQPPSRAKCYQDFSCQQQPMHALVPDSCNYLQNHLSYVHPDNSPSDLTSVNPTSSAVKTETNELTSPPTRDSSHTPSLFQSINGSHDLPLPEAVPTGTGKGVKLHRHHGSQSQVESNIKPANIVVQATSSNPGSMTEEAHYNQGKSENHSELAEVRHFIPAELGSSNVQESSTSSGKDDASLEAASFRQLKLVMEQLDLRTKICIRDSLYRLARSAAKRHNHGNSNSSFDGVRDASGTLLAEGEKSFVDIETDTNPIDRSVAHLLFHRPSESSPASAQYSLPFKSPSMVRGSDTSRPVMKNLIESEEADDCKQLLSKS